MRTIALIFFILITGCSSKPQVKWTGYTPEKMEQAMASGQPVIAYFYAAWCHPCVMLKEHTFSDPRVIAELEPYQRIKIDMSFIHSPKIQQIAETYDVKGMPTLIVFGRNGKQIFHESGFLSADDLLKALNEMPKHDTFLTP